MDFPVFPKINFIPLNKIFQLPHIYWLMSMYIKLCSTLKTQKGPYLEAGGISGGVINFAIYSIVEVMSLWFKWYVCLCRGEEKGI